MTLNDKKQAFRIYLYLGALFITSLVVSNLIFQKFFYWKRDVEQVDDVVMLGLRIPSRTGRGN